MDRYFPEDLDGYAPWVAEYGLVAPYGKCQCGHCDKDAPIAKRTRPECKSTEGEPVRFSPGHQSLAHMKPVEVRFWSKVDKGTPDACWEWQASKFDNGYGIFNINRKTISAHRTAWMIANGPIPNGMYVCHKCDNPACVNPAHLFLHTPDGNMKDKVKKSRQTKGTSVNTAKLTVEDVKAIRERYANGNVSMPFLAREYSVSMANIWAIIRRKVWKSV